ncbi:hypothetical protein E2C01_028103 [Portunus trituberculatus]|uniref:Uncharacterized protein n=1 Tax=Portunus trituberculatus TaxID=210409 RepID=A0A5B7EQQ3_PORTR|nr:hypothetical protein [Portunus trituberculatus]
MEHGLSEEEKRGRTRPNWLRGGDRLRQGPAVCALYVARTSRPRRLTGIATTREAEGPISFLKRFALSPQLIPEATEMITWFLKSVSPVYNINQGESSNRRHIDNNSQDNCQNKSI